MSDYRTVVDYTYSENLVDCVECLKNRIEFYRDKIRKIEIKLGANNDKESV